MFTNRNIASRVRYHHGDVTALEHFSHPTHIRQFLSKKALYQLAENPVDSDLAISEQL